MVSMKVFVASAGVVAKACGGCGSSHAPVQQVVIDTIAEHEEFESESSMDDAYFTSRGYYGSSRVEEEHEYEGPEQFERTEVDCSKLKGNQTLPAECSVFPEETVRFEKIEATNSTATVTDECDHLSGLARLECLGTQFTVKDCEQFRGNQTMPFECSVKLGMVDPTKPVETIVLEEAQAGDELTWDKAFQEMFPELMNSTADSCFSCDYGVGFVASMFDRLATRASYLVKSIFDEPALTADDVRDCSMQLGNQTMTVECEEELDADFNATKPEPKISPLGFIVEEVDCEALARQGTQTLPFECYQKLTNSTNTTKF